MAIPTKGTRTTNITGLCARHRSTPLAVPFSLINITFSLGSMSRAAENILLPFEPSLLFRPADEFMRSKTPYSREFGRNYLLTETNFLGGGVGNCA